MPQFWTSPSSSPLFARMHGLTCAASWTRTASLLSPGLIHEFRFSECPSPGAQGTAPCHGTSISPRTGRTLRFLVWSVVVTVFMFLATPAHLAPQLRYSFSLSLGLWPVPSQRLSLASPCTREPLRTGGASVLQTERFALPLAGLYKCNRGRHGRNLLWNPELTWIHIVFWVKDLGRSNVLSEFIQ